MLRRRHTRSAIGGGTGTTHTVCGVLGGQSVFGLCRRRRGPDTAAGADLSRSAVWGCARHAQSRERCIRYRRDHPTLKRAAAGPAVRTVHPRGRHTRRGAGRQPDPRCARTVRTHRSGSVDDGPRGEFAAAAAPGAGGSAASPRPPPLHTILGAATVNCPPRPAEIGPTAEIGEDLIEANDAEHREAAALLHFL